MAVFNAMEKVVEEILEDIWEENCKELRLYPASRDDVMAIALNHIQPRYITTSQGSTFVKAQNFDSQSRADITKEVMRAINIVKSTPVK